MKRSGFINAPLVIRTGEDTAYANVILRCGLPFAV